MAEISYGHKRELYRVLVKAMLDKDGHKHFPKYTSEGLVVVYILSKVTHRLHVLSNKHWNIKILLNARDETAYLQLIFTNCVKM